MAEAQNTADPMEVDGGAYAPGQLQEVVQKEGFLGPVTAMFWDSKEHVLLAGRGCDILILDFDRVCLGSLRPFQEGRVHVIKSQSRSNRKLLVAASSEKHVTLSEVHFSDESQKTLLSKATVGKLPLLEDWVLDLQLLRPSSDGGSDSSSWELLAVGLVSQLRASTHLHHYTFTDMGHAGARRTTLSRSGTGCPPPRFPPAAAKQTRCSALSPSSATRPTFSRCPLSLQETRALSRH
eukprot:2697740-Rhodomonas_salina.1